MVYSRGHGDIGVAFEDGELELHYHFNDQTIVNGAPLGPGDHEYAPNRVAVRVTDQFGIRTFQGSALPGNFAFIGANIPGNLWILPQSQNVNAPFLGIATEDLDPADWIGNITFSLSSWVTPTGGNFSVWQSDGLGNPSALFSTFDPSLTLNNNSFEQVPESHDHYNFGFTEKGLYLIDFTASGTHVTEGFVSDTATFRFLVGDATAVPEPGSIALLCAGAVGAIVRIRSRRRKQFEAEPQVG